MKVVAISDLHGRLPGRGLAPIPECDVLLIAGDICPDFWRSGEYGYMKMRQMEWLYTDYREWEATVPAKHILAVPGNHDWVDRFPEGCRSRMFIDEEVEIDGIRFWFTPWVSPICDWNYMLERAPRKERFDMIPDGLDFLVAHSPAHKVLDKAYGGEECGCPELRQAIYRAKPRYMVHGHIHEGRRNEQNGVALGMTQVFNVAVFHASKWRPVEFLVYK